ncbi:MAG: sodium:proton antiporter [Defluviitaleaceae bacterium]|nr:sodium:proton antiporter [Defluviitaleaceae bacterium]
MGGMMVESLLLAFIMLGLIVISNLLLKAVPQVSLPLHQIFLGVLLGFFPISQAFHLETEMFMLLFVAPLLFMDSKHTQNRDLWKYKTPILLLALGLVFSTTMIVGPFISWMIPGLPLAASFALAAILSPTDAVSVKAISGKIKMPHNIHTIIEGESLLNDASGLVAFKFALAAQLTGVFSLWVAGADFILLSIGGIAVGVGLMYAVMLVTRKLVSLGVEDASVFTLIQIITPFVAFLAAEHFEFSGVLAVVGAGIFASMNRARIITMQEAHTRFVAEGAWSTLLFVLNGLVFVLLGMQLPHIV